MIVRFLKLPLLMLCIGIGFVLAWGTKRFGKLEWRDRILRSAHTCMLRIIGVKLTVRGQLSAARPLLLVTNHVSYTDIFILGSVFPFRFTPKQEIADWPVISNLCRVSDTVFVDRRPEQLQQASLDVERALAKGEVVCLFPEATTGNGIKLLPFKSGFFRLAETGVDGRELTVQPAAIVYTHIRRLPIDSCQWPGIAWYGDMELVPHVWNLLKIGHINAELIFLPPATVRDHGDRKQLSAHCHHAIAEAIQNTRERNEKPEIRRVTWPIRKKA